MLLAQSTRMSYGLPAQVGFDERLETRIDSIVMAGLEDRAYPGAVVQVVRHGKTVIHKAYGNKTFNRCPYTWKKIYEGGTKTDAMDYFGNEKQKENPRQYNCKWRRCCEYRRLLWSGFCNQSSRIFTGYYAIDEWDKTQAWPAFGWIGTLTTEHQ